MIKKLLFLLFGVAGIASASQTISIDTTTYSAAYLSVTSTYTVVTSSYPLNVTGSFSSTVPAITTVSWANQGAQNVISTYTVITTTYPINVTGSFSSTVPAITTVSWANQGAQSVISTYTVATSTYPLNVNQTNNPATYTVTPGSGSFNVAGTILNSVTDLSSTSWSNATAVDSVLTINTTGYNTVLVTIHPNGVVGTGQLTFEGSNDGNYWYKVNLTRMNDGTGATNRTFGLAGETAYLMFGNIAGLSSFRVRLSVAITTPGVSETITIQATATPAPASMVVSQGNANSLKVQLSDGSFDTVVTGAGALVTSFNGSAQPISWTGAGAQPVTSTNTVIVPPALTKGAQGATGLSTQDLKDAGRTFVVFVATGVAGVTSEALFSFQINKNYVVTQSSTTYTITNGKTFRIQGLYCSNRDGTTAISWTRAVIRSLSTGPTTASSPILFGNEIGDQAALAGAASQFSAPFPDGIEIVGDGTKSIGVSHLDQATTNLVSCTLVGYEY